MDRKLTQDASWIVTEGNDQILYSPKGDRVDFLAECIVKTGPGPLSQSKAEVHLIVNIAGSKQEMLDEIAKWQSQDEDYRLKKLIREVLDKK